MQLPTFAPRVADTCVLGLDCPVTSGHNNTRHDSLRMSVVLITRNGRTSLMNNGETI